MTDHQPADSSPYRDRAEAEGQLEQELARIAELQDRLYAEDRWALLLIFQAMDGACLLYTSPSPRDGLLSRMPSSA